MSEFCEEFWLGGEDTHRLIVDIAEEGIWILDPGNRIVFTNKKLQVMLGYAKDELLCRTIYDIVAAEDREILKKALDRRRRGETETYSLRLLKKDGIPVWVIVAAAPVMNKSGEYMGVVALGSEITQLKQAEEALRESEENFRVLAESSSSVIYVFQGENLVYVNDAAQRITGYSKDELLKMKFWDIFHPDFKDLVKERGLARQRGEPVSSPYEVKFITKSDETRSAELTSGRIMYMGKPAGVATFFDITERKRAEEALSESEEMFHALADTSYAAIMMHHGQNYIYANNAAEKITGYAKDELLSMPFWQVAHPDMREVMKERGLARLRGEVPPQYYEIKLLTANGETKWALLSAAQFKYSGRPAVFFTLIDITERKRAEEALRESEEKYRNLVENVNDIVWQTDEKFVFTYISPQIFNAWGYTPEEVIGKTPMDFMPPDEAERVSKILEDVARKRDKLLIYENRHLRKDGRIMYIEVSGQPIIDKNGVYRGYQGVLRDITERKRAEEALSDAKAQAELYVDLMGHDINNLNQVALGYLELADGVIRSGGKLVDHIELIEKPVESLNSSSKLIDKVMKLRKLKMGEIKLDRVDVCKVLIRICDRYSHVRGRDVTINYTPPGECLVMANELIDEIFTNLIENSIKHSPEDRPLVIDVLQATVCEDGKEYFRISIEDNGPGISDEVKDKLFAPFSRGETKARGKGLGLYLIKTLVEDFHGKVWVEDRVPGDYTKGAGFVVMLPTAEM